MPRERLTLAAESRPADRAASLALWALALGLVSLVGWAIVAWALTALERLHGR